MEVVFSSFKCESMECLALLGNQSTVRCLLQIRIEMKYLVKILVSAGEFSNTHTGCTPVSSSKKCTFAVQIVFICSVTGMYCTGLEWVLPAARLRVTKM